MGRGRWRALATEIMYLLWKEDRELFGVDHSCSLNSKSEAKSEGQETPTNAAREPSTASIPPMGTVHE